MSDIRISHRTSADEAIMARWPVPKLPKDWRLAEQSADGYAWRGPGGLSVIASLRYETDGKLWLHVSIGHRVRLPLWSEVTFLKETFIGVDQYAIQVFPPRSHYVNLNPHVLHLWHCLDGYPLPEFSGLVGGVRTI